jgi:hypothetical protein
MRSRIVIAVAAIAVFFGIQAGQGVGADELLKPFFLAGESSKSLSATATETKNKLTLGGFEVVGEHSPYENTLLLIVTNDVLKAAAAKSDFGGYAAAQRVSLSLVGDKVQISYTNPEYLAAAYRMAVDLSDIRAALGKALGTGEAYGMAVGMTEDDLRGYHYMFGMEYFDEPSELAEYDSHEEAIAALEKGLAAKTSGVSKVYRVDVTGKKESVFGVGMVGSGPGGTMQDDEYIMSQIDFSDIKSAAHLPYEILVSGNKVYALYARFRIAISFPDLSMMGSNSFMSILECPATIEKALTLAAGGTPVEN